MNEHCDFEFRIRIDLDLDYNCNCSHWMGEIYLYREHSFTSHLRGIQNEHFLSKKMLTHFFLLNGYSIVDLNGGDL